MTNAEFWEKLAEYLERERKMPLDENGNSCKGLCDCITAAWWRGELSEETHSIIVHSLWAIRPSDADEHRFWWPLGEVAPRIAACRELARIARERDGA